MIYFLLHTIVSAVFFWGIISLLNVNQFSAIILTLDFFLDVFIVFIVSLICSFLGRFVAYQIIRFIAKRGFQKNLKKFSNFFHGLNAMSRSFFIATGLSAIVYVGGLTYAFSGILGDDFAATFGAYILMEFIIMILAKMIDIMIRG